MKYTKKVLVTGGGGFIGSHLAEALSRDKDVGVLDNFSVGTQNKALLESQGILVKTGDIRDFNTVKSCVIGCHTVFHLAAMNRAARSIQDPLEANAVNVDGTLNVLEACRKHDVEKLVFASSSSVYGGGTDVKREDSPCRPLHPYGVGKRTGEEYCRIYHEVYGLKTVVLRYVSVYGPRQRGDIPYAAVVPKFIEQLLAGKPLTVFGDGTQKRHFTYVQDTVDITVTASQKPHAVGQIFNVAAPEEKSILSIVAAMERVTGKTACIAHQPPAGPDPARNTMDTTKIKKTLGVQPSHTLENGLQKMVQWYALEKRNP